mmetsp:Transcript_11974/g.28659  ORF Transcript_11974/g.28659 Transcript_11974/m.28659 type:complete len:85 (-) Transcript_11974:1243-1497(-)
MIQEMKKQFRCQMSIQSIEVKSSGAKTNVRNTFAILLLVFLCLDFGFLKVFPQYGSRKKIHARRARRYWQPKIPCCSRNFAHAK